MIHQARAIMTEAFKKNNGGESFLETQSQAFAKLSKKIRGFKAKTKQGVSHGYLKIITVIAMVAERAPTQANQGNVDTILRILDDVEENIETSLSIERNAEAMRLETFYQLTDKFKGIIAKVKARLAELSNEILTY